LVFKAWRSPAFRVQALAVLVAAFAMTAMLILRDTVDQRFNQRTAVALGADLILEGTRFPEPAQRQQLAETRHTESVKFSSVLVNDDSFLLASIRAVSAGFPLYGEIQISDSRFADPYPVDHGPQPGHVWIAGTGLDRLGLQTGEFITLGERSLLIDKVIVQEPDQQAGFYSMNPRALIHIDDLQQAAILGEGSRYRHNILVAADDATGQQLESRLTPGLRPDQELETVANTELRSRGPVEQLFLWSQLAVMLVVLLCAAAIYLTSSHRARHQQTLCAVMKTVGASQATIVRRLLGGDALALLIPTLSGIALASALGLYLITLMGGGMTFPVAAPVLGLIGPVLLWLGFAAPTLWAHLGLPATALLQQRESQPGRQRWTLLIALLTPIPLAAVMSGSLTSLWPLLLLTFAIAVGLPLVLWPLVSLLDRVSGRMPLAARLALRRLSRRKTTTLPLLAALVVSLAVLSMSIQTGRQLLSDWRSTLPDNAPNYFVINLFDQDLAPFNGWLAQHNSDSQPLYPVVRARLTAINGEPVRDAVTKEQDRGDRALNRDLSLTEADTLPDSNELLEGRWVEGAGEVTVESELAESLGLKLGDQLIFTGASTPIEAEIVGLRDVDWESFAPNFYFMFSPGTLEAQSRTWITSFYLPPEKSTELASLVQQFPQISLLDVNAILATLEEIVAQASRAAFFVGLMLMLAALLVLAAALLATADQMRKDNRLLVVIGARQSLLRRTAALQALFLIGGAALLANLIHFAALFPLGQKLFDGELPLSLWLLLPWGVTALLVLAARLAPPLQPASLSGKV
jgi:putative ABC transport system permease protein